MAKDIMDVALAFEEKMTKRYEKHLKEFDKLYDSEWKKAKMTQKFEAAGEDAEQAYDDCLSLVKYGGC